MCAIFISSSIYMRVMILPFFKFFWNMKNELYTTLAKAVVLGGWCPIQWHKHHLETGQKGTFRPQNKKIWG